MGLSLLLSALLLSNPVFVLPSFVSMGNSFPQPLTKEEEEFYIKRLSAGEEEAKEAKDILVERNLRLVAHIAKKYTNTGKSTDDLISTGTIGLIKSINTYNSSKAIRLATYSARCIENEILMSIRSSKKTRNEVSLSEPIGTDKDGNEISLNDILGTDTDTIIDYIDSKAMNKQLYGAVDDVLRPREREVIIKRYGLYGEDIKTQREVAVQMGISRSYVSRIEKKALEKLRIEFEKRNLIE